jgi:hypothetical protein
MSSSMETYRCAGCDEQACVCDDYDLAEREESERLARKAQRLRDAVPTMDCGQRMRYVAVYVSAGGALRKRVPMQQMDGAPPTLRLTVGVLRLTRVEHIPEVSPADLSDLASPCNSSWLGGVR